MKDQPAAEAVWYKLPDFSDKMPEKIWAIIDATKTYRETLIQDAAALSWAYHRDKYLMRSRAGLGLQVNQMPEAASKRFSWLAECTPGVNITKSSVDTLVAWLLSNQAKLEISTSGACYEQRRQVEARNLSLDATMNQRKAKRSIMLAGRDGLLKGVGAAMPCLRDRRVTYRRIQLHQLVWDPFDARDGDPRTMHLIEYVDRGQFLAWYESQRGKKTGVAEKIRRMARATSSYQAGAGTEAYLGPYDWELNSSAVTESTDRVMVVHSWRKASRVGATDGRYVCTVHSCYGFDRGLVDGAVVALDQKFKRVTFPVVIWSPYPDDEGILGTGLGHLMTPWQEACDRTFFKIQRTLDRLGHTKIVVPQGSIQDSTIKEFLRMGISVVQVENPSEIPRIIDGYALRKDDLEWLERLLSYSRDEYGINHMLAQGGSQLGADASGAARVEENYRQTDRLSDIVVHYDDFRRELGVETMNVIEDAIEMDRDFAAQYKDRDGELISVKWADLALPNGEYEVEIQEVGELGDRKAGQVAKILDLQQRRAISDEGAKEALLNNPDYRALARYETAGYRLIQAQLSELSDPNGDHEFARPDEDVDLELAMKMARKAIQDARSRKAKPETVNRLRQYYLTVKGLIGRQANGAGAAAQAMQASAPMPGPGAPAAAMPPDPVALAQGSPMAAPGAPDIAALAQAGLTDISAPM
jgi:hypothetical protein